MIISKKSFFNFQTPIGKSMPGVVYVSRLPWGFDEEPMRSFFSQFGTIDKLRVSRSKKVCIAYESVISLIYRYLIKLYKSFFIMNSFILQF